MDGSSSTNPTINAFNIDNLYFLLQVDKITIEW